MDFKKLREDMGLTQEEVAKQLGVAKQTYIFWERKAFNPNMKNIKKVCDFFNIDVSLFINR
jgi:DNA-binding XRE family transcriptional regulator